MLNGGSVIGNAGGLPTTGRVIFCEQDFHPTTGAVVDNHAYITASATYWLNPDNGPANAFITIDLGAAYSLASFTLFNMHNAHYRDRGTGESSIAGSNTLMDLGGGNFALAGATTLASAP